MQKNCFKNKKITVMGLGLFGGGVGITKFLVSQGADVTVTDLKDAKELSQSLMLLDGLPVKYRLGQHVEEDFSNIDMLIVNPAVPNESKSLQTAKNNNIVIDTELNIFFKLCPAPIIGITGSNGKSTTTSLLGEMLKRGGINTWVGGNIGVSLLEHIDEIKPDDVVVLEISSFQLENLNKLMMSPFISIVTNIAPNHLDRHKTMADYVNAKKAIMCYQNKDDYAILNYDDPILREWENECNGNLLWFSTTGELKQGAFIRNGEISINYDTRNSVIPCLPEIKLKGIHNIQNIMAAACAASIMHTDIAAITNTISNFSGLEHRLEFVRSVNGVKYYNDSKATTPEAAIAGIRAFNGPTRLNDTDQVDLLEREAGRVILIAGGYDKGVSLDQFAKECAKNTKCVILIGKTAEKIQELIQDLKGESPRPEVYIAASFDGSVQKASSVAESGDVVLLSPACASYGMFANYEERGKRFKEIVYDL